MYIIAISLLIFLMIIGFLIIRKEYRNMLPILNLVKEFLDRYKNYIGSNDRTEDDYEWLLRRVDRVQRYFGHGGLVEYKPPYSNYVIHNYRIITETVSILGTTASPHIDDLLTVKNMLIRYIDNFEIVIDLKKKELRNPLVWIREGAQFTIALPLSLLNWFGIIEYSRVEKFRNNFIVKIISSIVAFTITLIGIIDGLLNIYTNWPLINKYINYGLDIFSH